jgi:hypothetical protein
MGELDDRQSMISRKYGVLSVRHGPGSEAALPESRLCVSAHSETVNTWSGRNALRIALDTDCSVISIIHLSNPR